MKKKIYFLISIIYLVILGCCINVNAIEIETSDIPNNTYVIGTHVFTGDVTLTTKHIMLGATTISSNQLDDMIIYYKTPRGTWIDGLSGDTITSLSSFDIEYINGKEMLATPTISSPIGSIYNNYLTVEYEGTYAEEGSTTLLSGVEFYEKKNGEYELIGPGVETNITANLVQYFGRYVEINPGESKIYVARVYREDSEGNKTYSEYSNELTKEAAALATPTISSPIGSIYNNYLTVEYEGAYAEENSTNVLSGVEFYEKKNGEYELIGPGVETNITANLVQYFGRYVEINPGESKIYVARVYREDSEGNKTYSEYSNELTKEEPANNPE